MFVEIRFHGRGGQGAVTAANLLVAAALKENKYGQAFPFFGAERRGAPVLAFARISDRPIKIHSEIRSPDIVVVLDPSLLELVDVTRGLKKGGVIVINSKEVPSIGDEYDVYVVDATSIALKYRLVVAGWPLVNTAMLGALSSATGVVGLKSIVSVVEENWHGDVAKRNVEAVIEAFNSTRKVR